MWVDMQPPLLHSTVHFKLINSPLIKLSFLRLHHVGSTIQRARTRFLICLAPYAGLKAKDTSDWLSEKCLANRFGPLCIALVVEVSDGR